MPPASKRSNVAGLEKTIRALAARIGPEDEALVALARGLAAAVDAAPDNAALWREYRAAVAALTMVGADQVDDDTTNFLLSIRAPMRTAVGDAEDAGPVVARADDRRRRRTNGSAADAMATDGGRRGRRDRP